MLLAKSSDFAELESLHHDLRDISQAHLHNRLECSKMVEFSKKLLTGGALVEKLRELLEAFGE